MPETYIIEVPGHATADRTRMLRDELISAVQNNTPFPLARAFEILPLTQENQPLAEKVRARGMLALENGAFINEGTPIDEKIVDPSLREFNAYIPRRIRLAAVAENGMVTLRSEGSDIIATISSLPPELAFGERFVLRSVEFTADTVIIDFPEEDNVEHLLTIKINLLEQPDQFRILRQQLGRPGQRATLSLVVAEAMGDFSCCIVSNPSEPTTPLPGTQEIRVHFKIIRTANEAAANNPTIASIQQIITNQLADMRIVYGDRFIVTRLTTEALTLADVDIDTGNCAGSGSLTAEQTALFGNRNNVGANELVIYITRTVFSSSSALNGCAAHPANRPGAILARALSSRWVLGHEIGHVLGLNHVNSRDQLMYGSGTANITNPPPDLADSEIRTMQDSVWTLPINS